MGLGNFLICPFAIPNGWSDPTDARSHCDQFGAQKAAVVYTCINILYGIFIGYATKHLIQRMCRSIREHYAKRKRIYEQGKRSERERVVEARVLAEKARIKAKSREAEENANEIARDMRRLEFEEDALDGSKDSSSRRGQSSRSRKPSKHSAGTDSPGYATMSGALGPNPAAEYGQAATNPVRLTPPPVSLPPPRVTQVSRQDVGLNTCPGPQPGPLHRRGPPQSQGVGASSIGRPPPINSGPRMGYEN